MINYKEERPWGTFENLLDTDYCKVKEIVIKNTVNRNIKLLVSITGNTLDNTPKVNHNN